VVADFRFIISKLMSCWGRRGTALLRLSDKRFPFPADPGGRWLKVREMRSYEEVNVGQGMNQAAVLSCRPMVFRRPWDASKLAGCPVWYSFMAPKRPRECF